MWKMRLSESVKPLLDTAQQAMKHSKRNRLKQNKMAKQRLGLIAYTTNT